MQSFRFLYRLNELDFVVNSEVFEVEWKKVEN